MKPVPMVEMYVSDFGNIKAPGLGACMNAHEKTKRWKWALSLSLDVPRKKEYLCRKSCPACQIEMALNRFAEKVWLTGGLLTEIRIDAGLLETTKEKP